MSEQLKNHPLSLPLPPPHTHTHTHTQDMRTLRFAHKQETHSRRGMYDRLQIVSFPASYGKNVFAYAFAGNYQEDGWDVYDAKRELQRLVRRRAILSTVK